MTEREQIIKGLLDVVADLSPFAGDHEDWTKVHRAIKYLKEQEAVKPMTGGLCGQCGCRIYQDANYCYNCGKKVKWDE